MCHNSRAAAATFVASVETSVCNCKQNIDLQLAVNMNFAETRRFSVSRGEQFGGDKLLPPIFAVTGILKLKSKAASILQQCT